MFQPRLLPYSSRQFLIPTRLALRAVGIICAAAVASLLGGCVSPRLDVKVTATARQPVAPGVSFRLLALANTPSEKEFAQEGMAIARTALINKGLKEAGEGMKPDLFIAVGSGRGPGTTRFAMTAVPVYAMIPGRTRIETQITGYTSTGNPIYTSVTVQDPPTQVLAGHNLQREEIKSFTSYFRLIAFDRNPTDDAVAHVPLWSVHTLFESREGNLRKALPVLAAAGVVFAGQATEGPVIIHMSDTDPDVAAIRTAR